MKFTIDENYITDVHITKEYSILGDTPQEAWTEELTVKVLKGLNKMTRHSVEDHPEFAKLRDTLEQQGFISTQRNCWNGDRVLKKFELNGIEFKPGDKFVCAGAMRVGLTVAKKYGVKYKPNF